MDLTVTVIIPTLNSATVLDECLKTIRQQKYDQTKIEILVCDGGSKDSTRQIAQRHGAKILDNTLKTGEAGKALGLKHATGKYVALIDSDNYLPDPNWLNEMIEPLERHPDVAGSEPWKYTWRKEDGFITRYCALIGMNDPLVHFLGNYDRWNLLTGKWTEVEYTQKDFEKYVIAEFNSLDLPTIGANGTVFRTDFLKENFHGDYLFDIDVLARHIKKQGSVKFVKTKNGIIHSFCERDISKFARKQRRRIKDYIYHNKVKKDREFEWVESETTGRRKKGLVKFAVCCVTFFPLVIQAVKGYTKKSDLAWFFHPLACEITLFEYGWGMLSGLFVKKELDRSNWKQ